MKLDNVEALRFFAAAAVVLYHVAAHYTRLDNSWLLYPLIAPFRDWGRAGVDVFFVISGFVIWYSTRERHAASDAAPFALRRLGRIFLGYWPWLAIGAVLYQVLRPDYLEGAQLWRELTLLPGPPLKVLGVGWTLTFELIFYAAFALLMLLGSRQLAFWVVVAWGTASAADGSGSSLLPQPYFSPLIAEFAMGVIAARTLSLWQDRLSLIAAGAVGLLAFSTGVFSDADTNATVRAISFGLCGLSLVMLAVRLEFLGIKAGPVLVFLGGASYVLYLCHGPIIYGFRHFWRLVGAYPDAMFGGAIVVSLLVSCGWWIAVDRPLNRVYRNHLDRLDRSLASVTNRPLSTESRPGARDD